MSVNITIKQTGLFKKTLHPETVIKNCGLSYGINDENFRLCENEIGEYTLLFNRENGLARGIEFSLDNNEINLRLSLPTGEKEISLFYELTKNLCRMLKTKKFCREGETVGFDSIEQFIQDDIKGSEYGLEMIKNDLNNGKYKYMQIFGLINPISLGVNEMQKIGNDVSRFEKYLDELQSRDVYYAAPKVYNTGGKLIGLYAVMPDNPTVLPDKPYIVLNQIEGIEEWYIFFGEGKIIKFEDLINNIDKNNYYDANHFVAQLSNDEINALVSQYGTEI